MSIGKVFTKSNITKYIVKGTGLAALGVVGYDAHIIGKMRADSYSKQKDADACMGTFSNTQYLSSPSMTTAGMKKGVHNFEMDSNFRHFVNSTVGYFKGVGKMLVSSVSEGRTLYSDAFRLTNTNRSTFSNLVEKAGGGTK